MTIPPQQLKLSDTSDGLTVLVVVICSLLACVLSFIFLCYAHYSRAAYVGAVELTLGTAQVPQYAIFIHYGNAHQN